MMSVAVKERRDVCLCHAGHPSVPGPYYLLSLIEHTHSKNNDSAVPPEIANYEEKI